MKKKVLSRVLLWGLVLLTMGVIFSLSAQNGEESGALSGSLSERLFVFVEALFPGVFTLASFGAFVRSAAHFTCFFFLALFSFLAFSVDVKTEWRCALFSFLFSVFYAISDEIHQFFVPSRAMQLEDVGVDALGALAAALICFALRLIRRRRRQK